MANQSWARAEGRARSNRPSVARLVAGAATVALVLTALAPAAIAAAAPPFSVSTPYPGVLVAPGNKVSFNINVTTPVPERVDLSLSGVPSGWSAVLHGGGYVIDSLQSDGTATPSTARLDVSVPTDAKGTTTITLTATAGSDTQTLPMTIKVDSGATGDLSLTTDVPSLKGPSTQTFSFNLTLSNDTAEDLTFAANAEGPDGWTVSAKLTSSSQAASAVVKSGSTAGITVSATPPTTVAAGTYDINAVVTAGSRQIPAKLTVEVTGSYELALSTPDQRLNGRGSAGSSTDMSFTVTNNGTAPITNVKLSVTPPSGWKVTFDNDTIASLGANQTQNVVAHIAPSNDAVAGDYVLSFKANGDQSTSSSVDIRFTVETSLQWAIVGIALIVAVVAGLAWVFQRYGRR